MTVQETAAASVTTTVGDVYQLMNRLFKSVTHKNSADKMNETLADVTGCQIEETVK